MTQLDSDQTYIFDTLRDEILKGRFRFDNADRYYDGAQRLEQLGLAIPEELMRFTVIVNWPRIAVDARAERIEPKGFRLGADDAGAKELWRLWQANDMDEQDMISRLEYQVYGRTYRTVGSGDEDGADPIITVESPREVITMRDPRTRKVVAALKLYNPDDKLAVKGMDQNATLYLPEETIHLVNDGGWTVDSDRGEDLIDEHGMGVVPVVPTFRSRRSTIPASRTLQGISAMEDVIPLTDAAARNLTNAQIAQETHAVPARGVLGATKEDFVDAQGKLLPAWESYFGAVWAISNPQAKHFQFDASDMKNFSEMTNHYARLASGVSGIPPNYFGLTADDAASADAIRSRLDRLIRACERDQVALGNADRDLMRIAMKVKDGDDADKLEGLETLWYDPGTPTYASRADAVVKQYTATDSNGLSLLPAEMAYEELGWSPEKVTRALELRKQEARAMVSGYLEDADSKVS